VQQQQSNGGAYTHAAYTCCRVDVCLARKPAQQARPVKGMKGQCRYRLVHRPKLGLCFWLQSLRCATKGRRPYDNPATDSRIQRRSDGNPCRVAGVACACANAPKTTAHRTLLPMLSCLMDARASWVCSRLGSAHKRATSQAGHQRYSPTTSITLPEKTQHNSNTRIGKLKCKP
jgi:hypothetical protein